MNRSKDFNWRVLVDVREPGMVNTGDTSPEYLHRFAIDAVTLTSDRQYEHTHSGLADLQGQAARHLHFLVELAQSCGDMPEDVRPDNEQLDALTLFVAQLGVGIAETMHVLENARSALEYERHLARRAATEPGTSDRNQPEHTS